MEKVLLCIGFSVLICSLTGQNRYKRGPSSRCREPPCLKRFGDWTGSNRIAARYGWIFLAKVSLGTSRCCQSHSE